MSRLSACDTCARIAWPTAIVLGFLGVAVDVTPGHMLGLYVSAKSFEQEFPMHIMGQDQPPSIPPMSSVAAVPFIALLSTHPTFASRVDRPIKTTTAIRLHQPHLAPTPAVKPLFSLPRLSTR